MATKKRIPQATLAAILKRRTRIADLQTDLDQLENTLLSKLKAGFELAPGALAARIKKWERRSVAWRKVCERELGEEYCQRVFNATKPELHENLVVETAA
jgi:hypothetical protein